MSKRSRNFALGTAVAAAVGYLAGVLSAPKSGKETRKDIARTASKARIEGEKQLKNLHSELNILLEKSSLKTKEIGNQASREYQKALKQANIAKDKARMLLSALHDGDADDPNLKAVIEEVKLAKENLAKFVKK